MCKFVSVVGAVVAAYTRAFSVGYYQVGHFQYQIVVYGLFEYCVVEFDIWRLAFNYNLRVEVLVKRYQIASEAFASQFYGVLTGHQLQRIPPLGMQPMYEMLPYLLFRGYGYVLFAQWIKNRSFHPRLMYDA
jgi:hypothetical protein